ncbi:hypothetical protein [Chamaesiphon sp. VAR_69_metabat_338]|uniref:hypothetical protein n=1 Tax=Chamaesiphon sp. VAR_69_metabat_338 TaxID=2964704 RepID=UPI00286E8BF1|nr:hypothetical protein [Chamaesiphon sp. VAR_69_metabat_338]
MLSHFKTHTPERFLLQPFIWSLTLISCLAALPSDARQLAKVNLFPTTGRVLKLTNGDLMCYVDLLDTRGKKHTLGADFAICDRPQFVDRLVSLTYRMVQINHCQGNDRCGKTIAKNLIVKMRLLSRK